jgi:catecholate siderophore receptor
MCAAVDNAVVLPDFVRVDAALYGQLTKNIRAPVNIGNLFDVNYIDAAATTISCPVLPSRHAR